MWKKSYIFFILVSLCFLVYANSLNNAFVSDDIPGILKNPLISSPLRFWLNPPDLLNSLNYLIAKYNPFTYHLTNIILHSLNTILVFFFLRLFFEIESSFLGAVLFAVHPIHTEAVTWISGKGYSIMSLFILSTYLLYQRATAGDITNNKVTGKPQAFTPLETKHQRHPTVASGNLSLTGFKTPYYLLSLFIFSYFIIQNYSFSFLLPFFLLISDLTFRRWHKNWKLWLPFLGIVILRIILARGIIVGHIAQVAKVTGNKDVWANPLFNLVYCLFSSLGLLLWPGKLTLYHEPAVISLFALRTGIALLVILALTLPFIFKKAKEIFFGIILFILFLAPTYSPLMVSWLIAERYLYFPSVSLSIFFAYLYQHYLSKLKESHKIKVLTLLIFIISAYAMRTVARNEDWKSPERLWRQTLLVSYNSPRAHNNMGDVYSQEGNFKGAIEEFKQAIALKTDYADAYHNLGVTYHHVGDLQKAIQYYQRATSFNPRLFESHFNLGVIYLNRNEWGLAIRHLKIAHQMRPDDVNAKASLEMAYKKMKN